MSKVSASIGAPLGGVGNFLVEEEALFTKTHELLGGSKLLKHAPSSRSEVHSYLMHGHLSNAVLLHLTQQLTAVPEQAVADIVGVSTRTLRRAKEEPEKAMSPDMASKAWLLAQTLAKAIDVFGSQDAAERWMSEEAMGLDGARPIDMLRTLQGAELVTEFLGRLEHGVYI